ncbi:hypothetical protein AAFC00_000937 [Neodothiora populina]
MCFVVGLDATILTSSLPNLAEVFKVDAIKAFWIASSFLLTSAVFQPPLAALADVFGRRIIYMLVVILFTVGTVVCCACINIAGMLAGRSIQGIGGGGVLTMNMIVLSDMVPLRQRAQYQGYLQLVFALGSNTAPIIGGAMIVNTTWRWLFLINLPFCALGLASAPFVMRYHRAETTLRSQLSSIDWTGMSLYIISVTSFLAGMTWGGTQYPWGSAATLCPLILGLAGLAGTILWEVFGAKKPFLRLGLFKSVSGIAVYICTVIMAFLIFGCVYYLVLYLIAIKSLSNVLAGVGALPFGLTVVPVSGITGTIISKTGKYQWAIWAGWAIGTLGVGLLVYMHQHPSTVAWVFIFVVTGIGQGLQLIAHSAASQAIAETKDIAYASSMYAFCRSLGLCFGVSIGGTIFQNFLSSRLQHLGLPVAIAHNSEGYLSVLKAMASGPEKDAIMGAYSWAFRMLFATFTGISGAAFLLSFFIGLHSLDKKLESEHTLIHARPREEHI